MLSCYPSVVPHRGLDFRRKRKTLPVPLGCGTAFIVLWIVFDPKYGFTGQVSVGKPTPRWGFVITRQGNISLLASHYLQIYGNIPFCTDYALSESASRLTGVPTGVVMLRAYYHRAWSAGVNRAAGKES